MITLYKGDDTQGQLGKKCIIKFHCDDAVDMTNVTVRFNLLNIVTKEFTNVHDGDELEVFVSHTDSRKLPLGIVYGKLWGEDSSGKVRTFANRIPFKLTTDLRCVYGSDGLDSVDVHVYSSVDWDAIANKPTLFPSKVSMVEGLEEALKQAGKVKTVNGQSPDANGNIEIEIPSCKVSSVNGKDGDVELTAQDIPYGGEGASNIETAIEQNAQAIDENADAIDSIEQQVGELQTNTYTKSEVDDKINQSAAHYLTKRAGTVGHYTYPQFATHADLASAKAAHTEANPQFFYGTEGHTPDKNDYCIVLADETHSGATTRYMFVGEWNDNGYFRYQYTINETAFTEEQWAAINSGITAAILAQLARKSDIPITTADIEDYANYRGHFDLAALYMKDDIVRAVKASTGEVAYFKSTVNNNRGVNPFTEDQDRWERTEDDEGLDKLSKFVKAAIATLTGADIPVSPTNADKIDVALGKKLDKASVVPPSSAATTGQAADAYETGVKLNAKVDDVAANDGWRVVSTWNDGGSNYFEIWHKTGEAPYFKIGFGDKKITLPFESGTFALVSQLSGITSQDITDFLHYKGEWKYEEGISLTKGDVYILKISVDTPQFLRAKTTTISTGEASEIDESFDKIYDANEGKTGLERLIDLFGESNSQLKSTIEANAVIFLRYFDGFIYKGEVAEANKITKFSELAAFVKTGRAVLQATATSASGSSPVLFRPHMINDGTGAQAANILFDATGTIDEGIYTRCIRAAIKAGTEDELMVQGDKQRERLAKYADVPYSVVDTVENRSVKRIVVETADAMTVTLPKPTASSGVIDFEVWFDASAYSGTYPSIGYKYPLEEGQETAADANIITKDGEDLAYGDGAVTIVHFTSVNGSAYTAVAASFK